MIFPPLCPFQENLAVVYTASRPGSYAIYEPVTRLKGQPKVLASPRPFCTKDVQSPLLEEQAVKAVHPTEPQHLQSVLHQIGGTGAFVFLFAKVPVPPPLSLPFVGLLGQENSPVLLPCLTRRRLWSSVAARRHRP